jgi:undecaprenyl-diphosphatase
MFPMDWWQLIILALIQGATEWLPISSSAHLILFPALTGLPDQGPLIDAMAHLGSLAAVFVYFRDDSKRLIIGGFDVLRGRVQTLPARLFIVIAVATIPGMLIGGMLMATGLVDALRSPLLIAFTTILFGVALWVADRYGRTMQPIATLTLRHAVILGLMQAVAFLPGVSRSGIAMTTARALGIAREEAARLGLLLGIPLIGMVGGYALLQLALGAPSHAVTADGSALDVSLGQGAVVAGLSFLAAWGSIALMMALLKRVDFTPFVIYRLVLGVALLVFVAL